MKTETLLDFLISEEKSPIIKVVGVGNGGCNAVSYMYKDGTIQNVGFVVCNTDYQLLENSPVPTKILLGQEGLGAGGDPEVARQQAIESLPQIKQLLSDNTKMVFITTGMGGGTGTGASPVVAQAAKELGILTVGIATVPFKWEKGKKMKQADAGIKTIKPHVDALLVIDNARLQNINPDDPASVAFAKADDVLANAVKGISEIITETGVINRDLNDVKAIMQDSGIAIMNSGIGEGENRLTNAIKEALHSPLLNDNNFESSERIMIVVYCSKEHEIKMREYDELEVFMDSMENKQITVTHGLYYDDTLGDKVKVTIIATGFESGNREELIYDKYGNLINVKSVKVEEASTENKPDIATPEENVIPVRKPEPVKQGSKNDDFEERLRQSFGG